MDLSANVPGLRRDAGEPQELRPVLAAQLVAAMKRRGMGADHFWELSSCLIPDTTDGQIKGGWLIIICRKTGLLGEQSVIAAPGPLMTGYPSASEINAMVLVLEGNLDALHRRLVPGYKPVNGHRPGSRTNGT
jgi:hypothetical protein